MSANISFQIETEQTILNDLQLKYNERRNKRKNSFSNENLNEKQKIPITITTIFGAEKENTIEEPIIEENNPWEESSIDEWKNIIVLFLTIEEKVTKIIMINYLFSSFFHICTYQYLHNNKNYFQS